MKQSGTHNDRWTATRDALPDEGRLVDWMQSDAQFVDGGKRRGGLWFLPGGMYVYYTPKFWRYSLDNAQEKPSPANECKS